MQTSIFYYSFIAAVMQLVHSRVWNTKHSFCLVLYP